MRFGRASLNEDLAVLAAVREAVGDKLELMVDCNQGWRMPWDITTPWDVEKAVGIARELEKLQVYWMEEPLHRGNYEGYKALRQQVGIRIAGGELTREDYEFHALLNNDCLDVYQPDVACTLGMEGMRRLAIKVEQHGHIFTPHTWGNGLGLVANIHLTAGATSGAGFLEFPYDPPEWSTARRDFLLTETIEPDQDGWLTLSDAPGLGIALDEAVLATTLSNKSTYV